MTEFIIVSLVLLGIILLDSIGDAFRANSRQNLHHLMETVGVATWIAIWALFDFDPLYIVMYVTARIWIFDIVFNIIAGNKWSYVGTSSLYGRILNWFTSLPMVRESGQLIWVLRVLALIWWTAWLLTIRV